MINIFKKRDLHTPEPERKYGFYAYSYYVTGGLVALLWVLFFTMKPLTQSFAEVRGMVDSAYKITPPVPPPAVDEEEPAPQLSPEEPAAKLYPMPAGAVKDSDYIDQNSITFKRLKEITEYMKKWESERAAKLGGKRPFIPDWQHVGEYNGWGGHPSMKGLLQSDFIRYDKNKTQIIKPLEYDYFKITSLMDFKPSDIKATIDGFYYEYGVKKYLPQGVCAFKPYSKSWNIVECGKEWQDFMIKIYFAKTNKDYQQASPYYQYVFINNQEMDRRKTSTLAAVEDVRAARADYIAKATTNKNKSNTRDSVTFINQAHAGEETNFIKQVKNSDFQQREALRFAAIFGAFILFSLSFLTGWKWSLFRKPSIIPQHVYIGGFVFLGVYWLTFAGTAESAAPSIMAAAFAFLPPLVFFALPVYIMIVREVAKESQFYQENILEGRGQASSRLAGFLTYFKRDITSWFRASKYKIIRTKESPIYLGRTRWIDDYKILQRDIGVISEQHLITIAGSGAGKSKDSIFNNILSYNGGMIAFDTKGEHVALAYKKRKAYAPAHVLDPYKKTGADIPRAYWNPLDEIDVNSNTARSDLDRIAAAIIPKEKGERAVDIHFRHIPQIIMRGYIAHILTTYPKNKQHLGTLYDLFIKGNPDGEGFDPLAVEKVVKEMAKNDALGGAPSSAAAKMATMDDRERAAHYSTIFRSIDWLNDPLMREIITNPSTFSVRDCKLKDASVFLILPEKQIYAMSRFLTLFYTVAFDVLDEHETKQPEGSKRRVLFLFDEFEALGNFEPARQAALRKRSSYIKCWYVVQNFDQFKTNYSNLQDFFGNADKQIFGVDASDGDLMEIIKKALGTYTDKELGNNFETKIIEKPVISENDLRKIFDGARDSQIFLPVSGFPMLLRRVPFFNNFGRKFKKR